MTERRAAHRYDLSLPVIIRVPYDKDGPTRNGKTRDISTRGVYFTIDQDLAAGAELDITLTRSEEHTSELQSQSNLVCRLLLEKKKKDERDLVELDKKIITTSYLLTSRRQL